MRARIAALPALLLIAVAVWEIAVTVRAARAVPHDDVWARATRHVRQGFQRGDLIVFAPGWADPVGRLHLGDLMSLDMAARMDAERYSRIWEVAQLDARAPEVAGLAPAQTWDEDGVTVRFYQRRAPTLVADVRDALPTVVATGGTPRLELAEVGFAPHRCIQVAPTPGTPARMVFPRLAVGRELVGYVGIADVFTRRDERSPIMFEVLVDGARKAAYTIGVEDGWVRFVVPTTPGLADVTFEARATAPRKLACFAAEARQ